MNIDKALDQCAVPETEPGLFAGNDLMTGEPVAEGMTKVGVPLSGISRAESIRRRDDKLVVKCLELKGGSSLRSVHVLHKL